MTDPDVFERSPMPQATITITIPDGVWIGDVSRRYPDAVVRVLAALTAEDAGVGLVEVTADKLPDIVADIHASDSVTELDILERSESTALLQFETTEPLLLVAVRDSGVPLEMPFTIVDGRAEWEVTTPRHRLSELATRLEEFGIPFTVDEVRHRVEPETLLTDRQLNLVRTAVERGYYDTPRRCSLTDLAAAVGLAKSTCSETLHRAEEQIIKRFVEEVDGRTTGSTGS